MTGEPQRLYRGRTDSEQVLSKIPCRWEYFGDVRELR